MIVIGPWDIEVAGIILGEIESLNFTYGVKSDTFDSLQGQSTTVYGAHSAEIEATFLETDITSLKAAIPQYWVPNGATLSTGEVITDPNGGIDIVPGNTGNPRDLILVSANNPGQVMRLNDTTSEMSGVDITGTIRKVKVKFNCQPTAEQALLQFFKEGATPGIS